MKILIVVDMQKDFIDGALGTKEAVAIVEPVIKRIKDSNNELILFTQDTHQENYLSTPEGKKLPIIHCIEDSAGWEIDKGVKEAWQNNKNTIVLPQLKDNTFVKPVFGSTALVDFLVEKKADIESIEILGLCTDICVVSNAIMIKNALPDIDIAVNAACCAGVSPKTHDEALSVMGMCQIDII